MSLQLLDAVALLEDRPDLGLVAGQTGVVVFVHAPDSVEVEFVDSEGRTSALATLPSGALLRLVPNPRVAA